MKDSCAIRLEALAARSNLAAGEVLYRNSRFLRSVPTAAFSHNFF